MVLGDFNHDGIPDVATSSNQLALGNGNGTFQPPTSLVADAPLAFNWIAAGDINNDGWTDILAATVGAYTYVYLNDREGGFTQSDLANAKNDPAAVLLADLNMDGNLDAVVTSGGAIAAVFLGDGEGGFTQSGNNLYFPFVDQLPAQVGDLNGDGIPDILLPADGMVSIALGKGNGTFLTPFTVGVGAGEGQILMQNLHGQTPKAGLPDLIAPDSGGGITVLINLTK